MTFYTIIKLKLTSFKAFIQYINLGKLGAAQREYNYKFYRCRENVLDFSGQNILKRSNKHENHWVKRRLQGKSKNIHFLLVLFFLLAKKGQRVAYFTSLWNVINYQSYIC